MRKKISIIILIIVCICMGIFVFVTSLKKKTSILNTTPTQSLKQSINTKPNNTSSNNTSSNNTNSNTPKPINGNLSTSNSSNSTTAVEKNSASNKTVENSKVSSTTSQANTYGYTYATQSALNSISDNYYVENFTIGQNSKLAYEISSVIISSTGVKLYSDYTGTSIYSSSEKMKIWKLNSSEFQTIFGVSPTSQGLTGNEFNVYSIGNVFIYQLSSKNILFSFENIAGTTLNNSNNLTPSNISNWYGTYTVQNKVGQLNGYNPYGTPSINITGQNLILSANEYKYGNVTILNPKYYLLKVPAQALLGTSYSGADLLDGSVYCLAVIAEKYPMTNFLYNALPSYTGCTCGAWAANVAMPIILGSNHTVQVMNDNYQIYSTTKNK